jgi:hypothetical protein
MSTKTRDTALQSLTIRGRVIPIGGEGSPFTFTANEIGTVTYGAGTDINSRVERPGGTLTCTVFPEDAAYPILLALVNEAQRPGYAGSMPGAMVRRDGSGGGERLRFENAYPTGAPDMVIGRDVGTVSFTFGLSGIVHEPL